MNSHVAMPEAGATPLQQAIAALFARDPFSTPLGIELVEATEGQALLRMPVVGHALNAHGAGHGGAVWTLADMAFGAAGFYDGPILTVGSDLSFIRPAPGGAMLYARATEVTRKGRTALFQITLSTDPRDRDSVVAAGMFTGRWL